MCTQLIAERKEDVVSNMSILNADGTEEPVRLIDHLRALIAFHELMLQDLLLKQKLQKTEIEKLEKRVISLEQVI